LIDNSTRIVTKAYTGLHDEEKWEKWGGNRNNPEFEANVGRLLALFRTQSAVTDKRYSVIHVRHDSVLSDSPLHPINSPSGNAISEYARPLPGEVLFSKNVNSAFIGTGLEAHLRSQNIVRLVIAGLTTNHCVSTTTRMAGNMGFEVILVGDACATFDRVGPDGVLRKADDIHAFALGDLHGEFCTVVKTDRVPVLIGLT
jgi:nicotinamidase-related amidase